jgi:hypothetical protein
MRLFLVAALAAAILLACAGSPEQPAGTAPPSADIASPLRAVPDPGADPAVVLLARADGTTCAGALIGADVVLTARRCISVLLGDPQCPASGPQTGGGVDLTTVRVLMGDDVASAALRARGRASLVPAGDVLCGADVALLLLDSTIDDVAPLVVRSTGAAVGDHARHVGFDGAHKIVRDHVPVSAVSSREIALTEAPCDGVPGGPAIDEGTGEIVGVLSRGGTACGASGGFDVDTRADVFASLVATALAEGTPAHATHPAKEKKGPIDLGASCAVGHDCAAGVCLTYRGARYCSRACGPEDRCPAKDHCMETTEGLAACVIE